MNNITPNEPSSLIQSDETQPQKTTPGRASDLPSVVPGNTDGDPFYWSVPDHVLAAKHKALWIHHYEMKNLNRAYSDALCIFWLIHLTVIRRQQAAVTIPDYLIGQVIWGGKKIEWPKNWRQLIIRRLKLLPKNLLSSVITDDKSLKCRNDCPMYQQDRRHQHFSICIRTFDPQKSWKDIPEDELPWQRVFLEVLELCGDDKGEQTTYQFHRPEKPKIRHSKKRPSENELPRAQDAGEQSTIKRTFEDLLLDYWGHTCSAYLPLLMFGPSPRMGLSLAKRRLMLGIIYELTRNARRKAERPDQAMVIVGGKPVIGAAPGASAYPNLPSGELYVGFNGNGRGKKIRLKGHGYKLKTWMIKTCFWWEPKESPHNDADEISKADEGGHNDNDNEMQENNPGDQVEEAPTTSKKAVGATDNRDESDSETTYWKQAKLFLKTLGIVAERFELTVVAWHPRYRQWLELRDFKSRTASSAGRSWLQSALIRIYAPADYLTRWRRMIAEAMGFSSIPSPDFEQPAVDPGQFGSPSDLGRFLLANKLTQTQFAGHMKIAKSTLSRYMTGSLSWTKEWVERVRKCSDEHPEWKR